MGQAVLSVRQGRTGNGSMQTKNSWQQTCQAPLQACYLLIPSFRLLLHLPLRFRRVQARNYCNCAYCCYQQLQAYYYSLTYCTRFLTPHFWVWHREQQSAHGSVYKAVKPKTTSINWFGVRSPPSRNVSVANTSPGVYRQTVALAL